MICPSCKNPIPGNQLACFACAEKREWAGAIKSAGRHIPDVMAGRLGLRLKRKARYSGERHLVLFNHYGSFCGIDLLDYGHREGPLLIDQVRGGKDMCKACLAVLKKLAAEANAAHG